MKRAAATERRANKLQAAISAALASLGTARPVTEVRETNEGLLISLTDDVNYGMFANGSAEPTPGLVRALDKITPLISQNRGQVIVRGHTDSRAYRSLGYDNWRLSTARAHMAYHMLIRGGLDARRIEQIEGYADRRPKDPNDPLAAPKSPDRTSDPRSDAMTYAGIIAAALLALLSPALAEETAPSVREPYQLVRTLQALQDEIARGNLEAHNAQPALLKRLAEKFQEADPDVWKDPRNSRAAVTFLLSGGDPQVVGALRSRKLLSIDEALLDGAMAYVEGRPDEARARLGSVNTRTLPGSTRRRDRVGAVGSPCTERPESHDRTP